MPHIETLRARLRNLATELILERQRAARGEGETETLSAAERRFKTAMADVDAEELLAITGGSIAENVSTAA